jgi:DNA-binding Lrp family transcriptional regulator
MELSATDRALIGWLSRGLPLVARPYDEIGADIGLSGAEVRAAIERLDAQDALSRFGIIVRHHELGYRANGMVVWDIPDSTMNQIATALARQECVTLCYSRPRRLPHWRYNLFTMIHGKSRAETERNLADVIERLNLNSISHEILFSTKRYKQRGASYGAATQEVARL